MAIFLLTSENIIIFHLYYFIERYVFSTKGVTAMLRVHFLSRYTSVTHNINL